MIKPAHLEKYGNSVWFDGEILSPEHATVSIMSHALHYGSGFFEGIRAYETEKGTAIFRLDEHLARLYRTTKMFYVEIPFEVATLKQAVIETVKRNGFKACYIRPSVFLGTGWNALMPGNDILIHTAISCWPLASAIVTPRAIHAKVASYRRFSSTQTPMQAKAASNYMNSLLLKHEAVQNGFDEAIALDINGQVSEASASNIFLVIDDQIHTPSLASSVLNGITRLSVIDIAKKLGYSVIERSIARDELYTANEVFITGTAAEVQSIGSVDRINIGSGHYPITERILTEFKNIITGQSTTHQHWLSFI